MTPARPWPRLVTQVPNILTLLALACSLTAVRIAAQGWHSTTILLLMGVAAILDGLDGRVARILDATSEMGAHLDSLCDAIGFGVAPAMIIYFLVDSSPAASSAPRLVTLVWLAIIIYVGAIVLRLARFNTLASDPTVPSFAHGFFVGVPAPMAGWLALLPVIVSIHAGHGWWSHPGVASAWLVFVACLAFSRLPTVNAKLLKVPTIGVPVVLVAALVLIGALVTFPMHTIIGVLIVYLAHIPFAAHRYRTLSSRPHAWDTTA
ncbi:MAG: CDP-alcohol phosphatidyltransferase family protein [Propionibacteriaceae bacterium]|nr:CDP-alcohol phosphatidyltransferase family protein [Propionibacteriaceae bacterium]